MAGEASHGTGDRQGRCRGIALGWLLGAGMMLGFALDCGAARATEQLKVPKPVPVRAGEMLADSFKAEAGDRVFFAEGSAVLGARARVALEAQAAWLKRHGGVRLLIEGHADDPGSPDINATLSQARADAVRERLVSLGVAGDRVTVAGLGQSHRAVVCAETACAGPNRRAVTRIAVQAPVQIPLEAPVAADAPEPVRDGIPGVRPALRRLF